MSSTLALQIVGLGLNFGFSVTFTRLLGAEGRGAYAVFAAASGLLVYVCALGFPAANAYYSAHSESWVPELITNSLVLAALLAVGVAAILLAWPGSQALLGVAARYHTIGSWFFFLGVPLAFLSQLLRDVLLGKHWFVQYNLASTGHSLAFGLLGLVLIACSVSKLTAVVLAFAASNAVPVLFCLWFLRRQLCWRFSRRVLGSSALMGGRAYGVNLAILTATWMNVFMLERSLGAVGTGLYSTALSVANIANVIPLAAVPVVVAYTAADGGVGLRLVLRAVRLAFASVLVVSLAVAALWRPILGVFGREFLAAQHTLWMILVGMPLLSIVVVLRSYFQGLGFPLITVAIPVVGLASNYALNLWLIPRFGILGTASALTLSHGLMAGLSVACVRAVSPEVSWGEFVIPNTAEIGSYVSYGLQALKRVKAFGRP
jgi:O-antigen/teichoic acid export membrane protein